MKTGGYEVSETKEHSILYASFSLFPRDFKIKNYG